MSGEGRTLGDVAASDPTSYEASVLRAAGRPRSSQEVIATAMKRAGSLTATDARATTTTRSVSADAWRRPIVASVLLLTLAGTAVEASARTHYTGHGARGVWTTETYVSDAPSWLYRDGKHRHIVQVSRRVGGTSRYVTVVARPHR